MSRRYCCSVIVAIAALVAVVVVTVPFTVAEVVVLFTVTVVTKVEKDANILSKLTMSKARK